MPLYTFEKMDINSVAKKWFDSLTGRCGHLPEGITNEIEEV
jgi:hypothetical protein